MSKSHVDAGRMAGSPTRAQTAAEMDLALAAAPTRPAGDAEMLEHEDRAAGVPAPRFEAWLMIALMVCLTGITLLNVIVRYLTNASFAFTEEVSATLMLVLVLVGTSAALTRDRHMRVNYLIRNLSKGSLRQLERVTALTFILAFAALAWYGGRQAWEDYEMEAVTPALGLPSWLFSIWLPLVSLLICARAVPVLIRGGYDDGVAA